MALIEEGIYSLLAGTSGVTALVSGRIYATIAPQNPPGSPWLVVSKISAIPEYTMGGECGLAWARIQVDAYADTAKAAAELGEQVRLAMSGYSGTPGSVTIDYIQLLNEMGLYEDDVKKHRISADYGVTYRQAIPT